jgi:hypothetical protein
MREVVSMATVTAPNGKAFATERVVRAPELTREASWSTLYRLAGTAALAVVALVPIGALVYILWPPPTTVTGWFAQYHSNPIVGLLNQDLLMMIDQAILIVLFLGLFVALRRSSQSLMTIALTLALVGTAIYFASNTAFNMLNLSGQYAAATTEAERIGLVGAGQAIMATYQGTAFNVGYVMQGVADLLIAIVMLRSTIFNRTTAWVGIAYGVTALIPASAGTLGFVLAFLSLVPMLVWFVLIARRLFRLARPADPSAL